MDISQDFYQPTPKEKQVWQVCDSLYTENKRITYQSIGERLLSLGLKRGSNTDICRYLASWKKHHFPKKNSSKITKKVASPQIAQGSTEHLDNHLDTLYQAIDTMAFDLQKILKTLESQTKNTAQPGLHALLVDIIKKQQERESHYLKALSHARDIQKTLKQELDKYQEERQER